MESVAIDSLKQIYFYHSLFNKNNENMKTIQLLACLLFISLFAHAQAVDFTATDCNSVSHNLFTELNAGKVVVIVWVMPCATCIAPALSAQTEVQNFQASHPGKVLYYLVDDYANTTCSTLQSWATTNGITTSNIFSDAAIDQSSYGSAGMPKIVVLGNPSHTVYFTQNNGLNVTNFNAAINAALNPTGLDEETKATTEVSLYPNPASDQLHLDYTITTPGDLDIDIYDIRGEKVHSIPQHHMLAGTHTLTIPTASFRKGLYMVRIGNGSRVQTRTVMIGQ